MCDPATAILGAGAVGGLSSLVGGGISAGAATSAAKIQANAAVQAAQLQTNQEQQALNLQQNEFNTTQANLAPFVAEGNVAQGYITNDLGQLTTPVVQGFGQTVSQALGQTQSPLAAASTVQLPQNLQQLAQTPGYQFALQQGLEATQNSYAAQGLGTSGAALKGAANYAEGLASTTYQQQYQNALNANTLYSNAANATQTNVLNAQQATNQQQLGYQQQALGQEQQVYNMLAGQQQLGESAAAQQGSIGAQIAQGQAQTIGAAAPAIAGTITSGAAAQAAGTVGSANAISNAFSGVAGAGSNTALLLALNQAGLFGGGVGAGVNQDFSGGSYGG